MGVRTISRGCSERCCSNKNPPPYHSKLNFVALRNRRPTLLRAPVNRTPSEASPRRRCGHVSRCPVRLSNSQDVSLIQRVLITLVLRLIMNDGFSFDSSIACSEFFRISWVHRGRSPSKVQQNVATKLAHIQEQSEFTYGAYLVAAGHLSVSNDGRTVAS